MSQRLTKRRTIRKDQFFPISTCYKVPLCKIQHGDMTAALQAAWLQLSLRAASSRAATDAPERPRMASRVLWRPATRHDGKATRSGLSDLAAGRMRILLASSPTFDPSVGDTFFALAAGATLCLAPRCRCAKKRELELLP